MDIRVKPINDKLYNCKFYTNIKFKTYLYSKGHFANAINKNVSFNFIYLITPISYNGLKGYNINIKLIKNKNKAIIYII